MQYEKEIIKIEKYEDFRENFAKKYLEDKNLKKKYENYIFDFIIHFDSFANLDDKNRIKFQRMIEGVFKIQNYYSFRNAIKNIIIIIKKDNKQDYLDYVKKKNYKTSNHFFYEIFENNILIPLNEQNDLEKDAIFIEAFCERSVEENNFWLNKNYLGYKFYFIMNKDQIEFYSKTPTYLQKILLLCNKINNDTTNHIYIALGDKADYLNIMTNESLFRLYAYLENYKDIIYIFDTTPVKIFIPPIVKAVKIFPALYINSNLYDFLSKPISKSDWDKITSVKQINIESSNKNSKDDKTKNLILQTCQKYLFDNFKNNASIQHAKLRKISFLNPSFFDMVKNIPIMALFVFALYDCFFRNDLLRKTKYLIKKLKEEDLVLNLQVHQKQNYEKYRILYNHEIDIKTMITWDGDTKIIEIIDDIVKEKTDLLIKSVSNTIKNVISDKNELQQILFHAVYICASCIEYPENDLDEYIEEIYRCFTTKPIELREFEKEKIRKSGLINASYKDITEYRNKCFENENAYNESGINELFKKFNDRVKKIKISCKKPSIIGLIKETLTTNLDFKEFTEKVLVLLESVPNALSIEEKKKLEKTGEIKNTLSDIEKSIPYELKSKVASIKYHPELISELFEAATISECLLQLMENAVLYANGGLLSIRVRDVSKGEYLDAIDLKEEYFNHISKETKEKFKFYLEINLADISFNSLVQQFKNNIEKRKVDGKSIIEYLEAQGYGDDLQKLSLKSFFEPTQREIQMWGSYYQVAENQIHHYGLQIFSTIVDSKQGIFFAKSSGDKYVNVKIDKEEKQFERGTSYRIFLPLRQTGYENDIGRDFSYFDEDLLPNEFQIFRQDIFDLHSKIIEWKKQYSKKDIITQISKYIKEGMEQFEPEIISLSNQQEGKYEENLELIIKAILLLIFNMLPRYKEKDKRLCLAITGLSSVQLLDSVRLLVLFLNKNSSNKRLENLQIFLKGERVGEEILLLGNNLEESFRQLKKASMMRGTSFDYYRVVQKWLK